MSEVKVDIPYQEKHKRLSILLRPVLLVPIILVMLLIIVPNHSVNPWRFDSFVAGGQEVMDLSNDREYFDLTSVIVNSSDAVIEAVDVVQAAPFSSDSIDSYLLLLGVYVLAVPLIGFSFWFMYVVNLAVAATLLFRKKYPDWWFQWNQSLQSFVLRLYCYALFLTDRYPTLEEAESHISLKLPNPKEQVLNRYLPLVKWLLVMPYILIYLVFLSIALMLVPITFVIVFITGRLPRSIHMFQVAVIRFYLNIAAYALLLVTDKYPKMIFRC